MELQTIAELSINDFIDFRDKSFDLKFAEQAILQGELIECFESKSYSPLTRKPFSLVFRTNQKTEYYPQGMMVLFHPEKGEIPLFFVPVGFDEVGMKYETVFA
jgi:hypothetical protein